MSGTWKSLVIPETKRIAGEYAKTVLIVVGLLLVGVQHSRGANTDGGAAVTLDEWLDIFLTVLTLGFGVWAVPNVPARPAPEPMPQTVPAAEVLGFQVDGRHSTD